MFLHVNLQSATCLRWADKIFDGTSEFYWTWILYQEQGNDYIKISQGFSIGCPINTGYEFNTSDKKYRGLNDPYFTVELPEVKEGEQRQLHLEIHCWESDGNAATIKKAFSNSGAQKLFDIWNDQQQKRSKTNADFLNWLESSDNSLVTQLISGGFVNSGAISIAKAALPVVKYAIESLKNRAEEYIGVFQANLLIVKNDGIKEYRWTFDNGSENWVKEEGKIYKDADFLEADSRNEIVGKFLIETTMTQK